jgi:hypothetical protein
LAPRGDITNRQRWVVGNDGARADHHRVYLLPATVHDRPRRVSRDPYRSSVGRGQAAVERQRQLHGDQWAARPPLVEVRDVHVLGLSREQTRVDQDAVGSEVIESLSGDPLVRVLEGRDDPCDAGLYQRRSAWRRAPVVRARLERHVAGGPPGIGGRREGRRFRMGGTRTVVGGASDDDPVPYEHRAHAGVGRREVGLERELDRLSHEPLVGHVDLHA